MPQKAFTLIEVLVIVVIVGLLATFAAFQYLNLLSPTYRATELNAAGAVRTGISLYGAQSLMTSRTPRFPAVLDTAPDGNVSPGNPFFSNVLSQPVRTNWVGTWSQAMRRPKKVLPLLVISPYVPLLKPRRAWASAEIM